MNFKEIKQKYRLTLKEGNNKLEARKIKKDSLWNKISIDKKSSETKKSSKQSIKVQKIIKDLKKGFEMVDIARELNVTFSYVSYINRKHNIRPKITRSIYKNKCQTCGDDFETLLLNKKYCGSWCRSHKNINKKGQLPCSYCKKYFDLDFLYGNKVCRSCNSKRINKRYENNPRSFKEANKKYAKKNPEKIKAWSMVKQAVKSGKIKKLPCEVCGKTKRIHGHHDDYSKPLDVVWLCALHHKERHKQLRDTAVDKNPL